MFFLDVCNLVDWSQDQQSHQRIFWLPLGKKLDEIQKNLRGNDMRKRGGLEGLYRV